MGYCCWECVLSLLEDARQGRQIDPVRTALMKGHVVCLQLLLRDTRIDINLGDPAQKGATPLYEAAHAGKVPCLQLLLADARVEVNKATTNNGVTPLYITVSYGPHRMCPFVVG